MASSLVSVPQYAQTGPCWASNQSRCDCMERPGERRKLGTETAECLRDLRATNNRVKGLNWTCKAGRLTTPEKPSKNDAKLTARDGLTYGPADLFSTSAASARCRPSTRSPHRWS